MTPKSHRGYGFFVAEPFNFFRVVIVRSINIPEKCLKNMWKNFSGQRKFSRKILACK
ncbi:hypothetical protein [Methanoregula formicica]|uniref:hypothetical protein n=1 Tax=Methanoregula formicica TaxID=882104 RepID=UPI00130EA852|nr:hypothetical protein [Methanoregula formicica]